MYDAEHNGAGQFLAVAQTIQRRSQLVVDLSTKNIVTFYPAGSALTLLIVARKTLALGYPCCVIATS